KMAVEGLVVRFRARIKGLFERFETAVDGCIEGFDLAVERGIEIGDAAAERGLELQQTLVQRSGDFAAIRSQASVEGVNIGLKGLRDMFGALPHPIDNLAAEGFDGAVEFRDVAGYGATERCACAPQFFRKFAALV